MRWKYKSEQWLESALVTLDVIDMEDTINSCLSTLHRLQKQFICNVPIRDLVSLLLSEVHRFNAYLECMLQLKHKSFKSKHFALLVNSVYLNRVSKPDMLHLSLGALIEDKVFDHSKEIFKIANIAKIEFNIH